VLADLAIGDRIARKADGGRRPNAIREIPGRATTFSVGTVVICGAVSSVWLLAAALAGNPSPSGHPRTFTRNQMSYQF